MPRQTRTGAAASACDWAGTEVSGDVLFWKTVLRADLKDVDPEYENMPDSPGLVDVDPNIQTMLDSSGSFFLKGSFESLLWLLRTTVESLGISLFGTGVVMDIPKSGFGCNGEASGQPDVNMADGTGPITGGLREEFVNRAKLQTRGKIFGPEDRGHKLSSRYGLEDVDPNHETMPDSPGGGFLEESIGALVWLLKSTVESFGIGLLDTGLGMDSHKGSYGGKASGQPSVSVNHGTGPPSGGLRQDKFVDRVRLQTRGGVNGPDDLGQRPSSSYGLKAVDPNHETMPDSPEFVATVIGYQD